MSDAYIDCVPTSGWPDCRPHFPYAGFDFSEVPSSTGYEHFTVGSESFRSQYRLGTQQDAVGSGKDYDATQCFAFLQHESNAT
ncbi:hypothetical protein, partial [Kineococcus sp. SYSU DK024]|uniref:hypothetical protein n=1 Tax=Kineococcus sp. SYSU DK024 TaxID=3383145 RepID=UPI003D7C5680